MPNKLNLLDSYNYFLPKKLIAQTAHTPADECKMLYCETYGKDNDLKMKDLVFKDIINLLDEKDVLFFNNSKVIKSRISCDKNIKIYLLDEMGNKLECTNCEIFFLELVRFNTFKALVRPGKKFKVNRKIIVEFDKKQYIFQVVDMFSDGRVIEYLGNQNILDVLNVIGKMPLPPYIEYDKKKEKSYQPIQAKIPGSVAATTASLHFTNNLLVSLKKKGIDIFNITLHIGMGTFKLVDSYDITNYDIHSEMVQVSVNIFKDIEILFSQSKKIVAVGTTVVRVLESLPYVYKKLINKGLITKNSFFDSITEGISDDLVEKIIPQNVKITENNINFYTKLFIYPGFKFNFVNKLITNFHLPKSSLLMLVAAFMGYNNMKKAYDYAIEKDYMFFSFGDAMFINKLN